MAMAGKHLAARFGEPAGFRVFALVSDGDLMEGVSGEASSLAGHLELDNLVFLYDDNHVTIDGDTQLAFTEDRAARYAAFGWHTLTVEDGNDLDAIDAAIAEGIAHEGQPTFISVKTIIGYGSVDAGTSRAHSDARGPSSRLRRRRRWASTPTSSSSSRTPSWSATGRRSTSARRSRRSGRRPSARSPTRRSRSS